MFQLVFREVYILWNWYVWVFVCESLETLFYIGRAHLLFLYSKNEFTRLTVNTPYSITESELRHL